MFVVDVESVFPYINVQKGSKSAGLLVSDKILIGSCTILKALGVLIVNKPSPTGALNCNSLSAEVGLESIIGAPRGLDQVSELWVVTWALASTVLDWSKRFPEEGVVPVSTTEEADLTGNTSDGWVILLLHGLLNLIYLLVVLHDVSLVMTIEMIIHLLLSEDGLKIVQSVG